MVSSSICRAKRLGFDDVIIACIICNFKRINITTIREVFGKVLCISYKNIKIFIEYTKMAEMGRVYYSYKT